MAETRSFEPSTLCNIVLHAAVPAAVCEPYYAKHNRRWLLTIPTLEADISLTTALIPLLWHPHSLSCRLSLLTSLLRQNTPSSANRSSSSLSRHRLDGRHQAYRPGFKSAAVSTLDISRETYRIIADNAVPSAFCRGATNAAHRFTFLLACKSSLFAVGWWTRGWRNTIPSIRKPRRRYFCTSLFIAFHRCKTGHPGHTRAGGQLEQNRVMALSFFPRSQQIAPIRLVICR